MPFPVFQKGQKFVTEVSTDRLNKLSQGAGRGVAGVSGNVAMTQGPEGVTLHVPHPIATPSRCYVVSASATTALSATLALDTIAYDVPPTNLAAVLGTLSGGVLTLTKPGLYHVSYTAFVSMDLSGATGPTPGLVLCTAVLTIGGTSFNLSLSGTSASKIPNFDGFVMNEGDIEQSVNLAGATGLTAAFEKQSVVVCDSISVDIGGAVGVSDSGAVTLDSPQSFNATSTCIEALTSATLDGGNQQAVTLDDQDIDVTTSLTVIADSEPAGVGYGTMAGQALVRVIQNSSGIIKILDPDGVTERAPTIAIYATVTNGAADSLTASLSLFKL